MNNNIISSEAKVLTMEKILQLNGHIGHSNSSPSMRKYIYGTRSGLAVFDLEKVVPLIRAALAFLMELSKCGGTVLFLGSPLPNERTAAEIVSRGHLYIQGKWIGGLLTNYSQVTKSISKLNRLLELGQDAHSIHSSFYGLRTMVSVPDALIIWNMVDYKIALEEASKLGIPVIAVVDSDESDTGISYPIPGNSDSREFIYFLQDLALKALSK